MMIRQAKKLKGFTLIELIVVIAIFGMIMFGALAMMGPVSKQFNSTARFENVRANLDNVRLYIENSLRYADRVHVYNGFDSLPTDVTAFVEDGPKNAEGDEIAIDAVDYFSYLYRFQTMDYSTNIELSREAVDSYFANVEIYVMEIQNSNTDTPGKISLYTYNREGNLTSSKGFAVNQVYYEDWGFQVSLGAAEGEAAQTVVSGTDVDGSDVYGTEGTYETFSNFSPGNFSVNVQALEKDDKNGGYDATNFTVSAAFALSNVTDSGSIKRDLFYAKRTDKSVSPVKESYTYIDSDGTVMNPSVSYSALRYKAFSGESTSYAGNNIYIVYTLPKDITT